MTKKILIILISTLYIYSCTPNDYVVNVKIDDKALNGTTVFLKERINREWFTIDSTEITNQKIVFKGIADTAKIAYLVYEFPKNNQTRQEFVLENGKITVNIDNKGFMKFSGTKQNELLQKYQDEKHPIYVAEEENYNLQKNDSTSPLLKQKLEKEMDKLSAKELDIDKNYSQANINTLVGNHIFMNSFYAMSVADKETIIALMNNETKKIKKITEIIENVKIEKKVAVGQKFSDFKLPNLEGDSLSVSDFVGKTDYLLIDFWASWCGPCIRSLPDLKELYNKHKGTGFQILGVSLDEDKNSWSEAIKSHNINWIHVSDLKGWNCQGSRTYAVNSIPSTVLINKKGEIIGKNLTTSEIEILLLKMEQ